MLSAKASKRQAGERAAGTVVYCGPTLPGIAKQYTVYKDGVPPALAARLAAEPTLRGLLVPLDRWPEAMQQLREKSGAYYSLFAAAVKSRGSDNK